MCLRERKKRRREKGGKKRKEKGFGARRQKNAPQIRFMAKRNRG